MSVPNWVQHDDPVRLRWSEFSTGKSAATSKSSRWRKTPLRSGTTAPLHRKPSTEDTLAVLPQAHVKLSMLATCELRTGDYAGGHGR